MRKVYPYSFFLVLFCTTSQVKAQTCEESFAFSTPPSPEVRKEIENIDPVNFIYDLGFKAGTLTERILNYKSALVELRREKDKVGEEYVSAQVTELLNINELNTYVISNLQIDDKELVRDIIYYLDGAKKYLDKAEKLVASMEEVEPMLAQVLGAIGVFKEYHGKFTRFMKAIGNAGPLIGHLINYYIGIVEMTLEMDASIIHATLFDAVADKSWRRLPIRISKPTMGLIKGYEGIPHHWYYWFQPGSFHGLLSAAAGSEAPILRWRCSMCKAKRSNTYNARDIEKWLEKHAARIYIALDELRIAEGPKAFPIFMGGTPGLTELGDSRRWRKPALLEHFDRDIASVEKMILRSERALSSVLELQEQAKATF